MKILGCGLDAAARGADVSPAGICRRPVTVAGTGPRIRAGVGTGLMSIVALALAACGGGSSSPPPSQSNNPPPPPPATQYSIGGTVSGLSGSGLVLQDNGGDNLAVSANGTFTFATKVNSGAAYAVTVLTQPSNPAQTCAVTNGSGTASADVTNVAVACTNSSVAGTTGKFAYTASNALGTIYAYTIDPNSGALTAVGTPYPDGAAPAAVSLAPNGKFAFSASDNGTKIHAFTIDQTSGALTEVAGSPFGTGFVKGSAYPDIAVDPQSAHLYLASAGDGQVAGFAIDANTGALTALAGSPYAAGTNAGGIPAFSPDGKYLYVVDQNATGGAVAGFSIDPTTGALAAIPGSPFAAGSKPFWISFTPDGKFAYVSNSGDNTISAYSVNAGALTALATPTFPTDASPQDLTIDSTGTHLYVPEVQGTSNGAIDVFTINADGTLAKVTGSPYPVGIGPRFVDIEPTGRFAYVSSAGTGGTGVYGFSIDPATGGLTALTGSPYDTGAGSEPQFITIDASGKFGYTANQGTGTISGFTIDPNTGVLSAIAGSPFPTGAKPFFVSISPEAPGIRD